VLLAQLRPDTELLRTGAASVTNRVAITVEGAYRVVRANGIPDHVPGQFPNRGNPNRISAQNYTFRVPVQPRAGTRFADANGASFGVALNGVPFEAGTAEFWNRDWKYEAIGGSINLGLDANFAHVQPQGAYHYHCLPTGLIQRLGGDAGRMLLIGWAADGYPIYTSQAHAIAGDAKSPVRVMRSSYQLKAGTRPGSPNGPGGRHDGAFTADYEFVKGSGDLDECNGRTGVTPEFPKGTYYYCITAEFPFFGRQWRGVPDASFQKHGPGGFGPPGNGRGRPPGPGRGGPPPF
jgi:hypothetical protein